MQKFTRPITREIDLNGQRLAVTFNEQGLSIRPVGTRKPPREITWTDLLTHVLESSPSASSASPPAATPAPAVADVTMPPLGQ